VININIEFRGINIEVHSPKPITHTSKQRTHVLIKCKSEDAYFIDVKPFDFGPYLVPYNFEMVAWILVPKEKEIPRDYEIEEYNINSIMTRFNVRINQFEYEYIINTIPPQL
jgi:hypothetical protein